MFDIVISLLLVDRSSSWGLDLDSPLLDDEAEEDLGLVGELLVVQHDDDGLEAAARQEHPHRHLDTRGKVKAQLIIIIEKVSTFRGDFYNFHKKVRII